MSTATTTTNTNAMGIQELDAEMKKGNLTVVEVFSIIQRRIDKRTAEKRNQLLNVVKYRNTLALTLRANGVDLVEGMSTQDMPLPGYATAVQPNPALSTNPEQLAKQVFATVGAANIGAVIAQLTAQVVGSTATK